MAATADQITVEITAVYDQYERTMVQIAAITSRNMAVAEESAKKGGNAIEKALEKAASRLPGLIKNLAEGRNALHLLLQEGAEFLSIFGIWEPVLGGAVGAVDAIAGAMGAYETAADRAATAQKAFDQAMRDTTGILTESEQAAVDVASGLSLVEKGLLATAAQEIDDVIRAQKDQLDGLLDSAKGAEYSRVLEKLNLENQGYVDGIQAIGQAIQGGIQGATSFSDALLKIGNSLAQLLLQAALFGSGPLGKAFGSLTGLTGGLLGLAAGGGGGVGYDGGTGPGPIGPGGIAGHAAMGGQVLPGRLYEVGETGREWFAPSVPGQVIPNHVIKAAGGGGSNQPITFNISMAGANGDRAIAGIAAAAVKRGLAGVPEINRQHRIRFA